MKSILLPGTSQISTVISDTCNHVNNFAENGAKKQRPISIMSGNSFLLGQEDYLNHTKPGIKRIFLLLALNFLLCFGFIPTTSAAVTGPGAAWQYCRRITLSPVTTLADFQVKVTLTTAALGNPYTNVKQMVAIYDFMI